jgi:copper chaperone
VTTIDLEVQGMTCGACVSHVTQALKPIVGVSDVHVDLQAGQVRVNGPLEAGAASLISALAAAGYPAKVAGAVAASTVGSDVSPRPKGARGGCCCG